jgi:hypothetical protein
MARLISFRERRGRAQAGWKVPVGLLALALFAQVWLGARAGAAPYEISLIEKYSTNRVLLHFDAPEKHTYYLEYTSNLGSNGHPSGPWSNLFVAPNLADFQHYIIVDTRTARQRFYRLRVTTP